MGSALHSRRDQEVCTIMLRSYIQECEITENFINRRPFSITPDESIEVDMMFNSGEFPFYENRELGVKIIGLPYKGYDVSLQFFSHYFCIDASYLQVHTLRKGMVTLTKTGLIQLNPAFTESGTNIYLH